MPRVPLSPRALDALGRRNAERAPSLHPFVPSTILPLTARELLNQRAAGADVSVRLRDGRVFVGVIVDADGSRIELRPWGSDESRVFSVSEVTAASTVGAHSWSQAHEVKRRQRHRKPALVVGVDVPRRATGAR